MQNHRKHKVNPSIGRICTIFLLETIDLLLSCLIVAPCVIGFWRGTWELMGVYIYPENLPMSALISFLIGSIGHVIFTLSQNFFIRHIHPDKRRLTYYIVSRLYTAVFGIVCVNMWRGSWMVCDWLTSTDSIVIIAIVTGVALFFMIATRTVRNLAAAPFAVSMDHKSDYFDVNTMFRVEGMSQPGLYMLDTLFTVFVIGSLTVLVWRGTWVLIDHLLFPLDRARSAWTSFIIGYSIVLVTFIIHPILRCICEQVTNGVLKLLICDIFYIVTFFGATNSWRGVWNLLDLYIFPESKVTSYWLTTVVPFLILAAIKCSNSVLIRGIYLDAEEPGAESLDIQISFCKLHFERERSKKQLSLQDESQNVLIEKPLKAEIVTKSRTNDIV